MNCLQQKQIERLALGLSDDAVLAAHLNECTTCRTKMDSMQSLVRQLSEGHAQFDHGHEAAREQLLAILPSVRKPSEPVKPRNRIARWIGGYTMRQKIAFVGLATTILVGLFLVSQGWETKPLSAMEKMAEAVHKVKSCKCTQIVQEPEWRKEFLKPGEPPPRMEAVWTVYWLEPTSVRQEHSTFPQKRKSPVPEHTEIHSLGKPGILINHEYKNYSRLQPLNIGFGYTGCETLENLAKFSDKANKELGTKEINGKKVHGFEIDLHSMLGTGTRQIWIDTETNLPVLVHDDTKWPDNSEHSLIIKDIEYNIDMDPKLFAITPPEGYTDVTPKPLSVDEQVRRITLAMEKYAKIFEGTYPATHGNLLKATFGGVKAKLIPGESRRSIKPQVAKDADSIQLKVAIGFNEVSNILAHKPDPAYYGKTVTPKDTDKVLLRWKLDDGRYEVIFGDLRAETVTAERLRALEGK
jgi:hypothetical protein